LAPKARSKLLDMLGYYPDSVTTCDNKQ